MGIFSQTLDLIKPVLKNNFKKMGKKKRGSAGYGDFGTRNVPIPSSLMEMKEVAADVKTKKMASVMSEILKREDLAGDDNIFSKIAAGESYKGKMIRAFVLSHTMKSEIGARKMFVQSMMDHYIDGELDAYMNSLMTAVGDKPEEVRARASMLGADVLLDLDDSDFENIMSGLI